MVEIPPGTQSLERATRLLRLVVAADGRPSQAELIAESGLSRSTTSRLLAAMVALDLLERDTDGGYRGGLLLAQYATRYDRNAALVALARPVLEDLAAETGETVNLGVARGDEVLHADQIDAQWVVGSANWLAVQVPAHCSALGKVLAAYDVVRVPRGRLEIRTSATIATRAELAAELEVVRERGWAETVGELEEGLRGLGAPVHGAGGTVIAAIGVSGPEYRLSARRDEVLDLLLDHAARLGSLVTRRR